MSPNPSASPSVGIGQNLPVILTMGDPAGIGPEIIARAMRERPDLLRQVVVAGDVATLQRAVANTPGNALPVLPIDDLTLFPQVPAGTLAVVQACSLPLPVALGRVSALAGQAAADCIRFAAHAALNGQARAVVTAPIHKEALAAAGVAHPGHTEFLQALAAEHLGLPVTDLPVRMMLSCPGLRTVLVSIHVSLRQALDAVTRAQVLQSLRITHAHFQRCGMPAARIAVAGLNPHAGEGGLFG
nr:4-hydroxythreonine-4-phosphate dehydrogenase PdxA [Hydrogenophaga sp.]